MFSTHATDLHAAEQARRDAVLAEHGTVRIAPSEPQAKAKLLAAGRRARRLARHGQVWALYRQGWSGEKIAPHLGVSRSTVYRYLRSEVFPERKRRPGKCSHPEPLPGRCCAWWRSGAWKARRC